MASVSATLPKYINYMTFNERKYIYMFQTALGVPLTALLTTLFWYDITVLVKFTDIY